MPKLRNGHAPGHVRDTALDAFEAWMDWDRVMPEPTVEYEIRHVPHQITISRACGLVWNCTDIVSGDVAYRLAAELERRIRTNYAGCARAIVEDIKMRRARAKAV
jgi:hypothetical protein